MPTNCLPRRGDFEALENWHGRRTAMTAVHRLPILSTVPDVQPASQTQVPARPSGLTWLTAFGGGALLVWIVIRALQPHHGAGHELSEALPPYWGLGVLPFIALLLSIATLPLIPATHHWWDQNRNKLIVSLGLSALTLMYYGAARGPDAIAATLDHCVGREYIPFMTFLFSLYVISGGISLRGDLPANPRTNTAFLAIGALLASAIGTTGASMLLIRPLLQTNTERKRVTHTVIFFIFLVSNIGGCLLPIGDPPLLLGYLRGVPFLWTLKLWKEWALCCGILLMIYYLWDVKAYAKEEISSIQRDQIMRQPLRIRGTINFIWLAGVVLAVALLNTRNPVPGTNWTPFVFLRELVMIVFTILSLITTPRGLRQNNRFNYTAILEVAALFIGIFITMQVAIEVLDARGGNLGLDRPWQFFWITGGLSSFLDNAPTYVVFFETANAMTHAPGDGIIQLLSHHYIREDILIAISLGAVFMGANTYIGNGPNFMVKSIAEQSGVKMPSFFGYAAFAAVILLPVFALVTVLFMHAW
jgi:Na+/H+ antiporter NhaD/arsenite permease-like protein